MKRKVVLALLAVVLLLPVVFTGCQSGGIAQADYDQVKSQLTDAQSQLTKAQDDIKALQAEKPTVNSELQTARAKITDLENQIASLKAQYDLTGATFAETAVKIVKYYHETHVYSAYDLFVCSDMAAEVWNMLKAAGIPAIIVVGNKDTAINDILLSNHAWVLAEVNAGQYLALETTGGFAVTVSANILYYRGWSFDSPADLKSYNDLVKEYNIRVGFRNNINIEANKVIDQHNHTTNQIEADKYMAVINKLVELRTGQETILNDLMTKINGLAAVMQ